MDMPSMDMPSVDMPSMSMPSVDMKKIPNKQRKKNGYPHTRIRIGTWGNNGAPATVERSGKKSTIKNAEINEYWEKEGGGTKVEDIEDGTFTFTASSVDQAKSWYETLVYGGAKGE